MRKPLFIVPLFLFAACAASSQPAPLDAPMVDIPVASSSAGATPITTASGSTLSPPADATTSTNGCAVAIPARDKRKSRREARAPALLTTELQQLEQLYAATPSSAPDRPQLLRRLAEDYVELACARFASGDAAGTKTARQEAIRKYDLLAKGYPSYALLDEVYYYEALEYELAGDMRNARSMYYELIKSRPNSKLIPGAYFAFGELFFEEGKGDPSKYQLAEQAFREVIKYPKPDNVLRDDADKRLEEIKRLKGNP